LTTESVLVEEVATTDATAEPISVPAEDVAATAESIEEQTPESVTAEESPAMEEISSEELSATEVLEDHDAADIIAAAAGEVPNEQPDEPVPAEQLEETKVADKTSDAVVKEQPEVKALEVNTEELPSADALGDIKLANVLEAQPDELAKTEQPEETKNPEDLVAEQSQDIKDFKNTEECVTREQPEAEIPEAMVEELQAPEVKTVEETAVEETAVEETAVEVESLEVNASEPAVEEVKLSEKTEEPVLKGGASEKASEIVTKGKEAVVSEKAEVVAAEGQAGAGAPEETKESAPKEEMVKSEEPLPVEVWIKAAEGIEEFVTKEQTEDLKEPEKSGETTTTINSEVKTPEPEKK
jgi:hypothetical protein